MRGHTGGGKKEKKRKENPKNTWYAVKTLTHFFSKGTQNDEKIPPQKQETRKITCKRHRSVVFLSKQIIFFEKKGFGKFLKL
jgi:hypothetical protein